jgi:two-component system, LytTR family, sensor kinase
MKEMFPKKTQMLCYSLIGTVLLTLIPFTITMDHREDSFFFLSMISLGVLFVLVVLIFYFSLYLNLCVFKSSKKKILLVNIVAFLVVTTVSICIHYPLWERTPQEAVSYYVRDDVVRNIIIFIASFLAAKYYMNLMESQRIQMSLAELEKENLSNQVRGLMQQINPHFFFNALNTLSGIVRESPDKSEKFIDKLSQVFRYVLRLQDYEIMSLDEELKFMNDYIYLLKIRFEDMLQINIDNHADAHGLQIVPLCTQLLLENVIKHNRINRQMPMVINVTIDNDYLTICNSYLPKIVLNSNKLGLKNLDKRCEMLAGRNIVVEQSERKFCVRVPLIKPAL